MRVHVACVRVYVDEDVHWSGPQPGMTAHAGDVGLRSRLRVLMVFSSTTQAIKIPETLVRARWAPCSRHRLFTAG